MSQMCSRSSLQGMCGWIDCNLIGSVGVESMHGQQSRGAAGSRWSVGTRRDDGMFGWCPARQRIDERWFPVELARCRSSQPRRSCERTVPRRRIGSTSRFRARRRCPWSRVVAWGVRLRGE